MSTLKLLGLGFVAWIEIFQAKLAADARLLTAAMEQENRKSVIPLPAFWSHQRPKPQ
jgi:hypothetical protein